MKQLSNESEGAAHEENTHTHTHTHMIDDDCASIYVFRSPMHSLHGIAEFRHEMLTEASAVLDTNLHEMQWNTRCNRFRENLDDNNDKII